MSENASDKIYFNEELKKLTEDLNKMTIKQLLTSFKVKVNTREQKRSIINRIINEINFDEIQQNIYGNQQDEIFYLLREKCFKLEIPFENKDNVDVLTKKIKNYVKREYIKYTYDELKELTIVELKELMSMHYLKISSHDTEEQIRDILNIFYTEETPGRIRKMLYDGYIYYDGGFKNSILDQVNFIIEGIKREIGTVTNVDLSKRYKIHYGKMTINQWLYRKVLDPEIWKVFDKHANIYATKEGLISNLTEKFTPYKGTTIDPSKHNPKNNKYRHIHVNGIAYRCHIIVATVYCENKDPDKYTMVDHLDGKKDNNIWTNLKWCDHIENANNRHSKAKTTAIHQLDKDRNFLRRFESLVEASRETDVSVDCIYNCCANFIKSTRKNGVKLYFAYAVPKVKHDVFDKSKYTLIGRLFDGFYYDYYVSHDGQHIISGKTKRKLSPSIDKGSQKTVQTGHITRLSL